MNKKLGYLLFYLGLIFCIVPPTIATIEYFPLFKKMPEKGLSVIAVVFLFIAVVPLWKYIKRALKSPSAWMIWLVILIFSVILEPIVHQMMVIAFVSVCTSIIGAVCFKWSRKYLPEKHSPSESKI